MIAFPIAKLIRIPALLALLGIGGASARGNNVEVEVVGASKRAIPGEAVEIEVRITNQSGRTLRLGDQANWLTLEVHGRSRTSVPARQPLTAPGVFEVPTAHTASRKLNLEPFFDLTTPDQYSIRATVHIREWDAYVASRAPFQLDVMRPTSLWEREFGVPSPDLRGPPEPRKYALQKVSTLTDNLRLYVCVSDPAGTQIFGLAALGQMFTFTPPEAQLDRLGRLHVLHQNGARIWQHAVVSPQGALLLRHVYEGQGGRPRLAPDTEGFVQIKSGVRRPGADDLPAEPVPPPVGEKLAQP